MKNHRSHVLVSCFLLAGATALSLTGGCSRSTAPPDEHLGKASQGLDADQCNFFDVNGKDTICHHTGSVTHPFTLIKISDQACINGHAGHAEDYITSLDPASSLYDPTCNGQGCLPTAAPCDGTLECCTGSCVNGTCEVPSCGCSDIVFPVTCSDGVQYANQCKAACAGASECASTCACDSTVFPVTCSDGVEYSNQCAADCAGALDCTPSCACPAIFEPVTCSDGVEYANQCLADCAGAVACTPL